MDTCQRLVNSHIMPAWGKAHIDQVTVEDVEAWQGELSKRLSKATFSKVRSQLAQAFDYGIRRRVVDWNPAKIAELPSSDRTAREGRALTKTEARALLNVAADHRLGAWVVTAVNLGLRPGEVWAVMARRRPRARCHRRPSFARMDQGPSPPERDKDEAVPHLELPPRTVDALTDHPKRQMEERLLMGDRWPAEWSDLVFVSESGTPLIPSNLRRLISALTATAGIDGAVTPYSLRHTATSLLSASVSPRSLWPTFSATRTPGWCITTTDTRLPPTITVAKDGMEEAL